MDLKKLVEELQRTALVKLNASSVKGAIEVATVLRSKERIDEEMDFALKAYKATSDVATDCGHDHEVDVIACLEFFRDVVYPGLVERTRSFQICADLGEAEAAGKATVSSKTQH